MLKDVLFEGLQEQDPENITAAYNKYLEANSDGKKLSIQQKLDSQAYETPYSFFHDLKLSASIEIVNHEVGSEIYKEIDIFFLESTQLLLREVSALGAEVFEARPDIDDDSLDVFRDDFEKISKGLRVPNDEFLAYVNKYSEPIVPSYHGAYNALTPPETRTITQPLFSSLLRKSVLDTRSTIVPDPVTLSKAVSSCPNTSANTILKAFNNSASRLQPHSQASSQILNDFFHPNWYTLESPKWLQYKQKTLKPALNSTLVKNSDNNELRVHEKKSCISSLGPSIDLKNSIVGEAVKRAVWFENVGLHKLDAITKKYNNEDDVILPLTQDTAPRVTESANGTQDIAEPTETSNIGDLENKSGVVKIENLAFFSPEAAASLKDLEKEAKQIAEEPETLQKRISANLIKLNKLRQERYLHSTSPSTPSPAEVVLYKKIFRLMTLSVKTCNPSCQLNIQLSKTVPILINDYHGTLPGPVPIKPIPYSKTGRLSGIRGPYKKKSRFGHA